MMMGNRSFILTTATVFRKEGLVRSSTTIELPDEWHHLAFSWDSDVENGKEGLIYLDGFEVEYDQKFDSDYWQVDQWCHNVDDVTSVVILNPYNGKKKEVENRYLLGALDELVIFNDVIRFYIVDAFDKILSPHLEQLDSKIEAYWSFDNEPEAYDLLDLTEMLSSWAEVEGHTLLVPSSASVTNNIFHQNDIHSNHPLEGGDIIENPLPFSKSAGSLHAKYALLANSPARGSFRWRIKYRCSPT